MKLNRDLLWSCVGLLAVAVSCWLLYRELHDLSLADVMASIRTIPPAGWVLCGLSTVLAYAALAGYDRLALMHLRKRVAWPFITLASFTAYAVGHNIGASVFSGAVVRYRAYRTKGLTPIEVGVLVAFCSFTFALGAVLLGGLVLLLEPRLPERFFGALPPWVGTAAGLAMLGLGALYVAGSRLRWPPFRLGRSRLRYPRLPVALRQLVVAPVELIGAAAIIHFALPEAGHPGYLVVLGVFLASFSAALVSHAPGGLGVLEVIFVLGMPEVAPASVIAALLVFRLLYLLVPLAISIPVMLAFEHSRLSAD